MNLSTALKAGGRKYAVVVRTLELGFLLALIGLFVATAQPAIAQYVAAIVGSFGVLGSASIIAYQGANAWKGRSDAAPNAATPTATAAPRQSGMVQEPGE